MRRNGRVASVKGLVLCRAAFRFSSLVVLTAVFCLVGCGKGSTKSKVSGKVTLNNKPVMGTIVFVGSDGKEVSVPISAIDGAYTVGNLPVGEAKIMVRGMGGMGTGAPTIPKGGATLPSTPGSDAVSPPAKYAKPNNGLKYDVKAGEQTHDIPLTP